MLENKKSNTTNLKSNIKNLKIYNAVSSFALGVNSMGLAIALICENPKGVIASLIFMAALGVVMYDDNKKIIKQLELIDNKDETNIDVELSNDKIHKKVK